MNLAHFLDVLYGPCLTVGAVCFLVIWVLLFAYKLDECSTKTFLHTKPFFLLASTCLFAIGTAIFGNSYVKQTSKKDFIFCVRNCLAADSVVYINRAAVKLSPALISDLQQFVAPVEQRSRPGYGDDKLLTFVVGNQKRSFVLSQDNRDSLRYWIMDSTYERTMQDGTAIIRTIHLSGMRLIK